MKVSALQKNFKTGFFCSSVDSCHADNVKLTLSMKDTYRDDGDDGDDRADGDDTDDRDDRDDTDDTDDRD